MTRGDRRFRNASLALFAAGFATFASVYCVQPLMPLLSAHFHVTPAVSSLSLSITTGLLAFSILFTGLVSEAINRKRLMGWCLAASSLLCVLGALAPNWPVLLLLRALAGIALGGVPALALAYLAEETHASAHGFATGLYIGGTAIGGMSGRVISGVAADVGGWRLAMAAIGVAGMLATLIFARLLPASRNFRPRPGRRLSRYIIAMASHLRHGALPWVFVTGFALMGGFVTVYNYIAYRLSAPPYALDNSVIGAIFIVYLLGTAASITAGRLADSQGRAGVLAAGLVVMATGLLLTAFGSLVLIVTGIALLTIGFFASHGIASGWAGHLADHDKGQATGLYLLAYYIGSSVIGSLGGLFWAHGGWAGVVGLVSALLLLALVALLRLWRWQADAGST